MVWPFAHLWDEALSFGEFAAASRLHGALWEAMRRTARVPDALVAEASALGGGFRLVAIVEDWCGDASNTIPVVARWAEQVPGIALRLLRRDEHPDLTDAYLTGTSRAIPIVVILTAEMEEIGRWGPRPSELQAWVMEQRRAGAGKELYPEVRKWYAHDKGESTLREILAVMAGS